MSNQNKTDILRLIRSENVGPKTFQTLMALYGTADRALEALPEMSRRGGRNSPLAIYSKKDAETEMENCAKKGAQIITIYESEYPQILKQVKDAPPVLTIFGKGKILNKDIIAIVGARNASANGCRFAGQLATDLGANNIITASGLARGIDTAAHKGSLETGTIAVVAGGIDKIYPPENKDLFKQIGENGVVIAEMPFGAIPRAQNFPRRNRIISGISLGTVIVEASLNSGSLITARMALEQNREVFAVPGSPLDPRCKGTNGLIKQGAHLTEGVSDITDQIGHMRNLCDNAMFEAEKNFRGTVMNNVNETELEKARNKVIEKIGGSPTAVDDIISQTGFAPNIVITILLELELAGRLNRHFGNKVSLIYSYGDFFAEEKKEFNDSYEFSNL